VFHDPGDRATRDGWGVAAFPDPVDWAREDRRAQVEALLASPAPGAW
jgi:hypothetical protein